MRTGGSARAHFRHRQCLSDHPRAPFLPRLNSIMRRAHRVDLRRASGQDPFTLGGCRTPIE
jgi:hypothetical protein